jgi:hypothetical protein
MESSHLADAKRVIEFIALAAMMAAAAALLFAA